MKRDLSLIQFAEQEKTTIAAVRERLAMWILGYILVVGPVSRQGLKDSITTGESKHIDLKVQLLVESGLISEQRNGILLPTAKGIGFAERFGFGRNLTARPKLKQERESSEDIIALLKENVIQGRKTEDDEGIDDSMSGTPGVLEITQLALEKKLSPETIVAQGLTAGMQVVGEKFATKEYFIPDMLASAEAVGGAMEILRPYLEAADVATKGKFAIATVKGDIHDIGKNIVAILLKGAGYEVNDLGTDVPTEEIVQVVKKYKPDFLGLSAMLTTTMVVMGETIEALNESGLRDKQKILVGGAALSEDFALHIGADAYCMDGFHAIKTLDAFSQQKDD